MKLLTTAVLAACAVAPSAAGPAAPATPRPKAPSPATAAATAPAPAPKPCTEPERRQLDFWIGDWNVTVRARASPTSQQWAEAHGTQHVRATLSDCAIEENFVSDAPVAFAGRSFSTYDTGTKAWRQTWVDNSGSYLAFKGGLEGHDFVLYGEPRAATGPNRKPFQMRMVFSKITPSSLRWEWQRSEDAWATHAVMMAIDYTRVK